MQEEAIVFSLHDYITDCGSRDDMSIGDVLQIFTGSAKVPATGFDGIPKTKLIVEDRLPTASTCELSITFSRKMGVDKQTGTDTYW